MKNLTNFRIKRGYPFKVQKKILFFWLTIQEYDDMADAVTAFNALTAWLWQGKRQNPT